MPFAPTIYPQFYNKDVLFNPKYPVNPDSKPKLKAHPKPKQSNPIYFDSVRGKLSRIK